MSTKPITIASIVSWAVDGFKEKYNIPNPTHTKKVTDGLELINNLRFKLSSGELYKGENIFVANLRNSGDSWVIVKHDNFDWFIEYLKSDHDLIEVEEL